MTLQGVANESILSSELQQISLAQGAGSNEHYIGKLSIGTHPTEFMELSSTEVMI